MRTIEPLQRFEFEADRLMAEHPPVWRDRNKQVVFDIACPAGSVHSGKLSYSRWPVFPRPDRIDVAAALERVVARPGFFDYAPSGDPAGAFEWHLNFAAPHLFAAYGSRLFAQDEMQVAEHPALGALREALVAGGVPALTVEAGRPTAVLVAGVERRCRIATDRNPREGRPHGLYGNAFAYGSEDAVRRATVPLDPPRVSNIIAIAAPTGGGRYTEGQIEYIIDAAYSGFRAAAAESARLSGARPPVVVHSGFWGCGAFGGNRVLMLMLQIAASGLAGLDRLIFHLGDADPGAFDEARATLARVGGESCGTSALIERTNALGFAWGVSDGN